MVLRLRIETTRYGGPKSKVRVRWVCGTATKRPDQAAQRGESSESIECGRAGQTNHDKDACKREGDAGRDPVHGPLDMLLLYRHGSVSNCGFAP